MSRTKDAPSSRSFSPFYCERSVVTDVNRRTWTCRVETLNSNKTLVDVPWSSPYHHYTGGEGYHYMPEVGAHCYLAFPVDASPPFIMSFIAPPAVQEAKGDEPLRNNEVPGGSSTDVSYQSNRPDLNPGDLAMTTRDGNFIYLRRGGILQLGATPMAQRLYVPVRNFIRDFAENYELATIGGDVMWTVDRPELDPAGKAPCSYLFHLQEFGTDKKASVRVRHLPLVEGDAPKAAWDVAIAPQGIDRQTGAVSGPVYTFEVTTAGAQKEMIAGDRSIEVRGADAITIKKTLTVTVTEDTTITTKNYVVKAKQKAAIVAKTVCWGDENATEPSLLGNAMADWLSKAQVLTAMGPALLSPASLAEFQKVLSKVVMLK